MERSQTIHAATALLAVSTVIGLGYATRRHYLNRLSIHKQALATVDPGKMAKWQAAATYQKQLQSLQRRFVWLNYPKVVAGGKIVWIPTSFRVSPREFWDGLQANGMRWTKLQNVFQDAGYDESSAFRHLFFSFIPSAGPSPIPPPPSSRLYGGLYLLAAGPLLALATYSAYRIHSRGGN